MTLVTSGRGDPPATTATAADGYGCCCWTTVILRTTAPSDDAHCILQAFSDDYDDDECDNDGHETSWFCIEEEQEVNEDSNGDYHDDDPAATDERRPAGRPTSSPAVPSKTTTSATLVSQRLGVSIHLMPIEEPQAEEESEGRPASQALVTYPLREADTVRHRILRQRNRRFVVGTTGADRIEPTELQSGILRRHPVVRFEGGGGGNRVDNYDYGGDDVVMIELILPSGSSIVLVPANLTRTRTGRNRLNRFLLRRDDDVRGAEYDASPATTALRQPSAPKSLPPPLPDPRILFPTLQVQLLNGTSTNSSNNDEQMIPFPVNSPIGQEFETDLFKGKLLLVMRPTQPELDPYWNAKMFSTRKRRIMVQLQGQFRRNPNGTVFAGAEVSDPMKLGLLARGLSGVLLRIVEGFNPTVHYSFGTNESGNGGDGEEERAHIVVPAYSFFERVIATPPGQSPPALGDEWDEPKDSRDKRKNPKVAAQFQFNNRDTYSFSFYSMYMDLPTWQLVNLPIPKGDVSLKTFWRDSLLRICMYERDISSTGSDSAATASATKQHLIKYNRYAFLLQVRAIFGNVDVPRFFVSN